MLWLRGVGRGTASCETAAGAAVFPTSECSQLLGVWGGWLLAIVGGWCSIGLILIENGRFLGEREREVEQRQTEGVPMVCLCGSLRCSGSLSVARNGGCCGYGGNYRG